MLLSKFIDLFKSRTASSNPLKDLELVIHANTPLAELSPSGEILHRTQAFRDVVPGDLFADHESAKTLRASLAEIPEGKSSFISSFRLNSDSVDKYGLSVRRSQNRFFATLSPRAVAPDSTQSLADLFAFLDQIPVPLWLRDPISRRFQYINPFGAEHLGIPKSKFIGKTPDDIFPSAMLKAINENDQLMAERKREVVSQIDVLKVDQEDRTLSASKKFVKLPDSSESLLIVGDDVSRFKQVASEFQAARAETERAGKAKSAFLAQMSHEIRSPLNGLLATAHLLKDTQLSDDQARFVSILEESGNHLLTLISNILDFSKIEAGKMTLDPSEFNLTDLVETQTDLFSAMARGKGLALLSFVDPAIPTKLVADHGLLAQVIINLISNAIKFTKSGAVTVRADLVEMNDEKATVNFAVHDTGRGISRQILEKIFEPFSQGSLPSSSLRGTGLGLTISQSILELMQSKIKVSSTEGIGSEFTFTVGFDFVTSSTAKPIQLGSRPRILIVDDSNEALQIIKAYLRSSSYICRKAVSVEDAIEELTGSLLSGEPFDLVITDKNMPGANGYDLLKFLKSREDFKTIKTVLITSDKNTAEEVYAEHAGFDAYIQKPFKKSQLLSTLKSLLDGLGVDQTRRHLTEDLKIRGARVLVADDMAVNRTIAMALLQKLGCSAQSVATGREAVEALEAANFDVVLMDCQMPDLDGFEATALIRSLPDPRKARVPIIALTASATKQDEQLCLSRGMDGFLSKPIHPDALVAAIAEQVL